MKFAESILKALAEPVLVLDGSLRAVMANPAFCDVMQIAPGQLVGKSIDELLFGENGQRRLRATLDAVMANDRGVQGVEITCTVPPHTQKIFSLNAARVAGAESQNELLVVELRDVTNEKDTERKVQILNDALQQHGRELEETNVELESFTHSVSHDLRSPLRLTNKIAHLLLSDHGEQLPAGAVEKIHMILNGTDEMGKLIEDLLVFSQVKREPMKKRSVDMRRLAREALAELKDEQQGRDIDIEIGELPSCQADRALLKQVFLNLLGNALKFTRPCEKAAIHVGSTRPNGETIYYIRDNGVGFDMSHKDTMFLVFHRLHKTHSFEGSGVGLALVKRIIERHEGRIWAEGETNRGATFFFTLRAQSAG